MGRVTQALPQPHAENYRIRDENPAASRLLPALRGMEPSLENLEIYRIAHDLAVKVHAMSLALPSFERFEEGSQIRRSSKRVSANIVEGHTQRKYKGLYLSYLYRALGSSDETQDHLLLLHKTGSLSDARLIHDLLASYVDLSGKLFRFIQAIESRYEKPRYLDEQVPENELDGPADCE